MKKILTSILKRAGIYHPLQSAYRQTLRDVQLRISRRSYARYKGSGFQCNVCAHSYTKFIDDLPSRENKAAIELSHVVAGYGKNIICPNCFSTARERLVLLMLGEHFDLEGKKVLHLSPEKHVYNYLKRVADVTTADLHPGFYKHIDSKAREADLMELPYADTSFDLVVGNHILEHIPDDAKAMREIYRVVKNGGRAILQVPYSEQIPYTLEDPGIRNEKEQSRRFGQKDHVRIYAFNDYVERLRKAGFIVNILRSSELELYAGHAIQEGEHFLMIYKG